MRKNYRSISDPWIVVKAESGTLAEHCLWAEKEHKQLKLMMQGRYSCETDTSKILQLHFLCPGRFKKQKPGKIN